MNRRPPVPQTGALPDCATPRQVSESSRAGVTHSRVVLLTGWSPTHGSRSHPALVAATSHPLMSRARGSSTRLPTCRSCAQRGALDGASSHWVRVPAHKGGYTAGQPNLLLPRHARGMNRQHEPLAWGVIGQRATDAAGRPRDLGAAIRDRGTDQPAARRSTQRRKSASSSFDSRDSRSIRQR